MTDTRNVVECHACHLWIYAPIGTHLCNHCQEDAIERVEIQERLDRQHERHYTQEGTP